MTVAKQPAIPCAAGALVARVARVAGRPPARERTVKRPPPVKLIPEEQI